MRPDRDPESAPEPLARRSIILGARYLAICQRSGAAVATDPANPKIQIAQRIDRGKSAPLPRPPGNARPSSRNCLRFSGANRRPELDVPAALARGPDAAVRPRSSFAGSTSPATPSSIRRRSRVVDPYIGKLNHRRSREIRRQFTLLYINRGYINSGAIIPDQNVVNGVVAFRSSRAGDRHRCCWNDHFGPEYFRSRLAHGTGSPFNIENLGREQQILLQSPLVKRLNLELLPGLEPGEARLHADVLEANRYSLGAQIADDQSPTVGAVRGQLQGSIANILGRGDILTAQYGRSQGLNDGYVGYALPLDREDTRVSLRYDKNGVVVITGAQSGACHQQLFERGLVSRPVYRTPEQVFTLGASFERRQQQTFARMPFAFTAGTDNGKSVVTHCVCIRTGSTAMPNTPLPPARPSASGCRPWCHRGGSGAPRYTHQQIHLVARPTAVRTADLRGLGGIGPLRPPGRQSSAISNGADILRRARLGARLPLVSDRDRQRISRLGRASYSGR